MSLSLPLFKRLKTMQIAVYSPYQCPSWFSFQMSEPLKLIFSPLFLNKSCTNISLYTIVHKITTVPFYKKTNYAAHLRGANNYVKFVKYIFHYLFFYYFEGKKPELFLVCYITIVTCELLFVILYNTILLFRALL